MNAFDESMMREALREAESALSAGELPVGCVIAKDGAIVARGHNERETTLDPTAHAEIVALRRAAKALNAWRLNGCTLYVTLEPCPICCVTCPPSRRARVHPPTATCHRARM